MTDTTEVPALYGDPALARLWKAVRERLERRGRDGRGWLTLADPSPDERRALARLLGAARFPETGALRLSLDDLDARLSRHALGLDLVGVVEALGGPLVARTSAAAARAAARGVIFDGTEGHPALARHPQLADWLDALRARGTLSRLAPEEARDLLRGALDVVAALPAADLSLPVLAGEVTGSTHALDRGEPLGALVDRALAFVAGPDAPADRRELWGRFGVSVDAVSSTVLALNLRTAGSRLDPLLGAAADAGEPVHVTLRMLRGLDALPAGDTMVSVVENRSVLEAVADELGATSAPLVCTSGAPSSAGRRILELLRAGGARLRYHGDFDPEGIAIANGIIGSSVDPWRYDADAYLAAAERTRVVDELGPSTTGATWDGRLARAMAVAGARIYEEHVLADLVDDLRPAAGAPLALGSGPANEPEAWVAASRTRNFVLGDPLCDWLRAHGEAAGFVRDNALPGHDPRTDFRRFVLEQGKAFETGILAHLAARVEVRMIGESAADSADPACAAATTEAMRQGVPVIAQGVLQDPALGAFGMADLLVRADVLEDLVPGTLEAGGETEGAPDLGIAWHYRAVDVKFHRFQLLRDGHAAGDADGLPFLVQVWLYNRALGTVQGYRPPSSYLLGRGWVGGDARGTSALERLARVDDERWFAHRGTSLELLARRALDWIRRLRTEGAGWSVLPEPSVSELYPNLRRTDDWPWHVAKRAIGQAIGELTTLPRVSPETRRAAHVAGIRRWDDERVSAARLGIASQVYGAQLDAVLAANRAATPVLLPEAFGAADPAWREEAPLELFVDFETVSDLADDFEGLPVAGGQPLIFQIGCGSLQPDNTWRFAQWTADRLDVAEEGRIIGTWLDHVRAASVAAGIALADARLYHWSPAETSTLDTAYNAARSRHPDEGWPDPDELPWFDLLARLARAEPLTITGAFGFGLKPIAKAMAAQGLIVTTWGDGPTDGLGAMVGAWWCDREARQSRVSMRDLPLMAEIAAYNEVDCRVMAEVLSWLRTNR